MSSITDSLFKFLLKLYATFAIIGPFPGILTIILGFISIFSGNIAGSILLIGGIALLILNGYLQSVAERGKRGESISNIEKVYTILAMIIVTVFGFAVFMAWEILKLIGKAIKNS